MENFQMDFVMDHYQKMVENTQKWIIVRIDGKVAAISTGYAALAAIAERLAQQKGVAHRSISAETVGFDEIWRLRENAVWEDFMLFGTTFQKKVWRKLHELTHSEDGQKARLLSYSDFAELCQNRAGVRAVAHAIGKNPISVIIPCHLVIPKESIDKIVQIHKKAESTIFKGEDLCRDSLLRDKSIDFGEYSLGRDLKRELIIRELN